MSNSIETAIVIAFFGTIAIDIAIAKVHDFPTIAIDIAKTPPRPIAIANDFCHCSCLNSSYSRFE